MVEGTGMKRPYQVLLGDAISVLRTLPENYFHCCVTSPPYWLLRDYGVDGQIGQEETWEEFLGKLVSVFEEVKRVLRPDGNLWVNMGDGYVQQGRSRSDAGDTRSRAAKNGTYQTEAFCRVEGWSRATGSAAGMGLEPKQIMGQPWRLAFALQDAGWWLRSPITWYKSNAMPDSAKDRPGKSHEKIFLLAPSARYFYDQEGWRRESGGSARDVWTIPISRRRNKGHHATFPEEVPRRCILLGTSTQGCCATCGAPRIRQVEPTEEYAKCLGQSFHDHADDSIKGHRGTNCAHSSSYYVTVGWKNSCECDSSTVPCRVLDPFSGTATTGVVALKNGRHYTGIELNPEFFAASLIELEAAAASMSVEELESGQLSLLDQLEMELV